MKLLIAHSRSIQSLPKLDEFQPTTIIGGTNTIGEMWATQNNLPFLPFDPDWHNLNAPNAIIHRNTDGSLYNKMAGVDRNARMVAAADAAVALWDFHSPGTANVIALTLLAKKPLSVVTFQPPPTEIPTGIRLAGTTGKSIPAYTDLIILLASYNRLIASNVSWQFFHTPVGKLSRTGAEWLIAYFASLKRSGRPATP